MKVGAKHAFIILLSVIFVICFFFMFHKQKKRTCSEINEDFKICIDQKMIEHNLKGKVDCKTKAYFEVIDFCKQAVVEYE